MDFHTCYYVATFRNHLIVIYANVQAASVVWWSEFLATDPEVRVRFPALPDFSEKQWVWNGVHPAS
jgi:hypothetical protein